MPRRISVNPRNTRVHGHRLDRDAVRYYERNPNGNYRGSGGRVIGQRQRDGSIAIPNGAHRRQAAINRGRRLNVEVYEHNERMPTHESGCALVLATVAGGLGAVSGIAWAVWEALPI